MENEEIFSSLLDSIDLFLFLNTIRNAPRTRNNTIPFDPLIQYSEREYEEATNIFLDLISSTYTRTDRIVHKSILNILCTEYYKSGCDHYPNIDQIVSIICSEPCRCQSLTSLLNYQQIIRHYCITQAYIPSCFEFEYVLLYHSQMATYPTIEELITFIDNSYSFANDPLTYYQNDKTHVPTLGIDKLPIIKGNDDTFCALCQDVCSSVQDCIQLKPCNHMFHSVDADCLETSSIHNYLQQNNSCPICKVKIETD